MQIIVVGCGKVGRHLVMQLAKEGHSITVVDTDSTVLKKVTEIYDIMGVAGNGTSIRVLNDAGVQDADLVIAVTQSDEVNILCCIMARSGRKCRTIARVRDPIYLSEQQFFRELGISMVINPERAVAREMAALIRLPSAVEIDTFNKGRIELLSFRVPDNSMLIGKKLKDLPTSVSSAMLMCVAERENEVVIPDGNFTVQEGDLVSVITPQTAGRDFFKKVGLPYGYVRSAMIVGGGEIGYYLADRLIKSGIRVKIIEIDRERCEELCELLPDAVIINGDGTEMDLLKEERLDLTDAFVAATNLDEENIVLSIYAINKASAKVITKISHSELNDVVSVMDLNSVVSPMEICAETIVRYARAMNDSMGSEIEALYMLRGGRAEALEFVAKDQFSGVGVPLSELSIKSNIIIAGITRNGSFFIPRGADYISPGDSVIIVTTNKGFLTLDDILER